MSTLYKLAEAGDKTGLESLLLKNPSLINEKNSEGETALHFAAYQGKISVVQLLLSIGASVDLQTKNGYTALIWSTYNGNLSIVELILSHAPNINLQVTEGSWAGYTALMLAADYGHQSILELLIAQGANLDICSKYGYTALMIAANNGHVLAVKELLTRGAQIDVQASNGWATGYSALMLAAFWGREEVLKLLVGFGAALHKKDSDGKTALILAQEQGHSDAAAFLEKAPSWMRAKAKQDRLNSLKEAEEARFRNTEKARLAAEQQVLEEKKKREEVKKQLHGKFKEEVKKREKELTEFYESLLHQVMFTSVEIINFLVQNGRADVNACDSNGSTALILASACGFESAVSLLLRHHANPEHKKNNGRTALMTAAEKAQLGVTKVLLLEASGLNVDEQDSDGWTALMLASFEGNKELVSFLLENGAEVNIKNKFGETALQWALQNSHDEVVELLLKQGAINDVRRLQAASLAAVDAESQHNAFIPPTVVVCQKPDDIHYSVNTAETESSSGNDEKQGILHVQYDEGKIGESSDKGTSFHENILADFEQEDLSKSIGSFASIDHTNEDIDQSKPTDLFTSENETHDALGETPSRHLNGDKKIKGKIRVDSSFVPEQIEQTDGVKEEKLLGTVVKLKEPCLNAIFLDMRGKKSSLNVQVDCFKQFVDNAGISKHLKFFSKELGLRSPDGFNTLPAVQWNEIQTRLTCLEFRNLKSAITEYTLGKCSTVRAISPKLDISPKPPKRGDTTCVCQPKRDMRARARSRVSSKSGNMSP